LSNKIYNTTVFEETGRGVFARGGRLPYFYTIITPIDSNNSILTMQVASVRSENFDEGIVRPNLAGGRSENLIS